MAPPRRQQPRIDYFWWKTTAGSACRWRQVLASPRAFPDHRQAT
jgi:hypothetical protein